MERYIGVPMATLGIRAVLGIGPGFPASSDSWGYLNQILKMGFSASVSPRLSLTNGKILLGEGLSEMSSQHCQAAWKICRTMQTLGKPEALVV